ncbi:zinc-binding dehydrogenase [Kribbella sp. NPDC003505]|uniref:zinc-binding dehydrogenase n=1 Tax=Kribbella sp. NPDC003505 TaxID=3154448 RepID=UPI0033A66592
MKALVATGTPGSLVAFADVPEPTPTASEAVVQIEAFSVNRGEYFGLSGAYGTPAEAGFRPGKDVAGRVLRAAADGSGPAVGQRIVAFLEEGGWAERVGVAAASLAVLPDNVTATQAATLPLAGLTALRLVRAGGEIEGRRILLTGASGGVGHYLVELALAAGAEITALTGSVPRGRGLAERGAHVVQQLADATGSFDVVMESIGGDTFPAALAKLAPGGTLLWFGQASEKPVTLSFFDLFRNTPLTIKHFAHWISDVPDSEDLTTLVRLVSTGQITAEIGRTADWGDTANTLEDLYHRTIRGNAVLTLTD